MVGEPQKSAEEGACGSSAVSRGDDGTVPCLRCPGAIGAVLDSGAGHGPALPRLVAARAEAARRAARGDGLAAGAAGGSDLGSGVGSRGRAGQRRPQPRGGLARYGNGGDQRHFL